MALDKRMGAVAGLIACYYQAGRTVIAAELTTTWILIHGGDVDKGIDT
jgi:hypothetical protein